MTKEINLTKGQKAIIDDEDFVSLSQWKWYARWDYHTKSYYAMRHFGDKHIHMSREIMNTPKGMFVDHINHNTLDNRKDNLRNVTASQNHMNSKIYSNSSTGYKGIDIVEKRFRVRIAVNKTRINIGSFPTIEEAIIVYNDAVEKYHGEYRLRV